MAAPRAVSAEDTNTMMQVSAGVNSEPHSRRIR
jgi:hypothetical protein